MPLPDTPDFDPLAPLYRWMEYASFGPFLERCRYACLPACASRRRALILGDGDGRFTARLMAANAAVQVEAVDASGAMLAALRQRVTTRCANDPGRLRTRQMDVREYAPIAPGFDLVATHFLLDCLTPAEVAELVRRIVPALEPRALWVVSEFAIPSRRWLVAPARLLIRLLYLAFGWMTGLAVRELPDYAAALRQGGLVCEHRERLLGGLLVAEQWRLQTGPADRVRSA